MADAQRRESATTTLSIGEVLGILKKEFSDVSISKIRFLETEGLVTPARTPSGYRRFSSNDVERLRSVLTMQRDHYLPLKVIRENLEGVSDGPDMGAIVPQDFRAGGGRVRLNRAELAEHGALDEGEIDELEAIGLVWRNPAGHYDEEALAICTIASRLRAFGMESRHLRSFRVVTDREAGLIEQMITPYTRDRDGRARAQEAVREIAALVIQLHAVLLRAEMVRAGRA
ncbi:MAG: MerR family transcriptional regulator [Actinobacteria bacterium]|nr:MerR family transcriptional regulator [Actinomycetota bacterium]